MSVSPTLLGSRLIPLLAMGLSVGCNAVKDSALDTAEDTAPPVASAFHCGDVLEDELWAAANNPHRVTCDLNIDGATVIVEPGVEIVVDERVRIMVSRNDAPATLKMNGTAQEPILVRAPTNEEVGLADIDTGEEEPDPVVWGGVRLYELATDVQLSNVVMQDGGGRAGALLFIEGTDALLENVELLNSTKVGLGFSKHGQIAPGSQGITISGSAEQAVVIGAGEAHTLPATASDYTGNTLDEVRVTLATLRESVLWEDLGVPYVIEGKVQVEGQASAPAVLSVGVGADLRFTDDGYITFSEDSGASGLVAGEAGGESVTFTAYTGEDRGYWRGLDAFVGTRVMELHNATIEQGGRGIGAGLNVRGDVPVLLDGLTQSASGGYGVRLSDGAYFHEDSQGIQLTDNAAQPVQIEANQAHTIPVEDYANNDLESVLVIGSVLDTSVTWRKLNVPYVIDGDVDIEGYVDAPAILTIEAGVNMKFDVGSGFALSRDGGAAGLIADGTASENVHMSALRADEDGFWDGIAAYRGVREGDLVLRNTVMERGGSNAVNALIFSRNAPVTVQNVTLSNSKNYGFYFREDAYFTEDSQGLLLDGNANQGVITNGYAHTLPSDLAFTGETATEGESRGEQVIFLTSEVQVTRSVTWKTLQTGAAYWANNSIRVDGLAASPAVLTLEPGLQLWMGNGTALYVSGDGGAAGLIADSSSSSTPILFRPAEANQPGQWQGIKALDFCQDEQVILRNVELSYGGGAGDLIADGGIVLLDCDATLEDVSLTGSGNDGMYITSAPTMDNVSICQSDECGIDLAGRGHLGNTTNLTLDCGNAAPICY